MKVVWTLNQVPPVQESYFYNIWYRTNTHSTWMDPTKYQSISHALKDPEEENYKRIAIIELPE